MPEFTVETTYRMPVYRQRSYHAATASDACRQAIEDDDWSDQKLDFETAGETYITGLWSGADAAYRGPSIAVPSYFHETSQRKADHFHELLDQLAYVAQPMGLSQVDFECWLPRATAAIEKARAIIEERRDSVQGAGEPDGSP
ncbi:hypothetical protein O7A05_10780 [Mesorhizobium sp. Cs1330R2N1]|uniref:Uncharacterized protein n=2 Tax=Mesorhizobium argentiipisi TaxID=3015175 RepID=A0ABU8KBP7_9HYPH